MIAPPLSLPARGEIKLWFADTDDPALSRMPLAGLLSASERVRAERFHFTSDRDRFIARRGLLRWLLGRYLRKPPADVPIIVTSPGKLITIPPLQFNISHSGPRVVFAVSCDRQVGIDIERIELQTDVAHLGELVFSAEEAEIFDGMPLAAQAGFFFTCWTRKEALLKALGCGLNIPLQQLNLTHQLRRVSVPGVAGLWDIADLHLGEGHAAALACESESAVTITHIGPLLPELLRAHVLQT